MRFCIHDRLQEAIGDSAGFAGPVNLFFNATAFSTILIRCIYLTST